MPLKRECAPVSVCQCSSVPVNPVSGATSPDRKPDLIETTSLIDHKRCQECGQTKVKEERDSQRKSLMCENHRKPRALFCYDCFKGICGDCIGEGRGHDLHRMDNLMVVHRGKVAEVEGKLTEAEQAIGELRAAAVIYRKNLEVLENEEAAVLRRVEEIATASKLKVSRCTERRKTVLKNKVQLPEEKGQAWSVLRETVQKLAPEDFMLQWAGIERKCGELMQGCAASKVVLEKVDDIECELVPAYKFTEIVYGGFVSTATTQYRAFDVCSAQDVAWTLTVTKLRTTQVQLVPTDAGILDYPHKLIVIVCHADCTKEIRKSFTVKSANNTFGIANSDVLEEFCTDGNLKIRVGVRPLDALVEKRLVDYRNEQLKTKQTGMEQQMASLTNEIEQLKLKHASVESKLSSITSAVDYKCHTSHHVTTLWHVSGIVIPRVVAHLTDDCGRIWGLKVCYYPTQFFDGNIDIRIELCEGIGTNCRFFVELKHTKPARTILKSKTASFVQGQYHGWAVFTTWSAVNNDCGYYPKGNVYFRFGVKPLTK